VQHFLQGCISFEAILFIKIAHIRGPYHFGHVKILYVHIQTVKFVFYVSGDEIEDFFHLVRGISDDQDGIRS
jgi:hypothetical protein